MDYKLTKTNFKKEFIDPMVEKFGHKTYWNGSDSLAYGLKISKHTHKGVSFTSIEGEPIVLRDMKKNHFDMIRVLVHENAHSELHKINVQKKYSILSNRSIKEYEAEMVVRTVFSILEIKNTFDGADYYYNELEESQKNQYNSLNADRKKMIISTAEEIADVLLSKKDLIVYIKSISQTTKKVKSERKTELFKYEICCPCCGQFKRYKRRIDVSERYCFECGEEKTLGKMKLIELDDPTVYAF